MKAALIILLFCFANLVYGQHKVNLSAGVGYPCMLHGELGYQFKQFELSGRFGQIKSGSVSHLYSDLNLRYHFMKQANMIVSNQHYWTAAIAFGNAARRSHFINGYITTDIDYLLTLCAGHHFELSNRFNFEVWLGPSFDISQFRYDHEHYRFLNLSAGIKLQWEIVQTEGW